MNAPLDQNFVKGKLGVWCVDGITLIPIAIDTVNGGVEIDTTSTISYTPNNIGRRDENFQAVLMGISSVDGSAIPINVNASGAVLIES